MAWARVAAGTIWKLAAIETGPGTIHGRATRPLFPPGPICLTRAARRFLCRSHGETKHWMPPRRARQHKKLSNGERRFWSVYIAKPGSKNVKEIRVDAKSGQILALQTERSGRRASEKPLGESNGEGFNVWMTKSRKTLIEY
jgi:hypothetical protein